MRKAGFVILLFLSFNSIQAQQDTISDVKYLEDQFYVSLTYNMLTFKPSSILQNGFSGGFSAGFIKDIPLNEQRNIGFGIGLGYAYNTYIQNLKITKENRITLFNIAQDFTTNRLGISTLDVPIEFRWRNSTPQRYKFWRIYGGVKFSYLLVGKTKYSDLTETITTKNIPELNKFQYGLILATGYSTLNLYFYYGLKPFFKGVDFNGEKLNLKDFNVGVKFYIM